MNIIIGDSHGLGSYYYINAVIQQLDKYKMLDFLLEENAYDFELYTRRKIQEKIDKKEFMIGDMFYQLGMDWKLPIIGIDLPIDTEYGKDIKKNFKMREEQMMSTINKYSLSNNCLSIVGDTHLRSIRTIELGGVSPIYSRFAGKKDTYIIRADKREIDLGYTPKNTFTQDEFFRLIMSKEFINKYKRIVKTRRFTS